MLEYRGLARFELFYTDKLESRLLSIMVTTPPGKIEDNIA